MRITPSGTLYVLIKASGSMSRGFEMIANHLNHHGIEPLDSISDAEIAARFGATFNTARCDDCTVPPERRPRGLCHASY